MFVHSKIDPNFLNVINLKIVANSKKCSWLSINKSLSLNIFTNYKVIEDSHIVHEFVNDVNDKKVANYKKKSWFQKIFTIEKTENKKKNRRKN